MSQGTSLYNMLIIGTCLLTQFQGTQLQMIFKKKKKNSFVACATFFQPGEQAQLFGGDRGRRIPHVL